MRVQIKDLKPNPFRDMDNYPIIPEKIESLTNSINQTGFWDNILARRNDGKIEIAYGHHRLIVLKKLFRPADYVDIPVKELDDATMIRIMANENYEAWETCPAVIDETINVTMRYLKKSHIMHNMTLIEGGKRQFKVFEGLPLPKKGESQHSIISWQIADWLGNNWSESKIWLSLKRIDAYKDAKEPIAEEAIKILPTGRSATKFIKAVREVKDVTLEQQKRAAEKIVEEEDFSQWGIKRTVFEEKVKDIKGETPKDKEEQKKIAEFFHICAERVRKLVSNIEQIMRWRNHPVFNMYINSSYTEAKDFAFNIKRLLKVLIKYWGEDKLVSIINDLTQEVNKERRGEIDEIEQSIN